MSSKTRCESTLLAENSIYGHWQSWCCTNLGLGQGLGQHKSFVLSPLWLTVSSLLCVTCIPSAMEKLGSIGLKDRRNVQLPLESGWKNPQQQPPDLFCSCSLPGGDDNHRGFYSGCFRLPHELHSEEPRFRRSELRTGWPTTLSSLPGVLCL